MSNTNLNLYKIFCVVAESKNYAEAGEKLYLTESTISSHIKKLEECLDITLFYRERDGLILTDEGKRLYNDMNEKIKAIEFAEDALIQDSDISKARIVIGCPTHISIAYLAEKITHIKNDYPEIKIDIRGAENYSGLIQLLQKHEVDFVILDVIPPEAKNEIKVKALKRYDNILISNEPLEIKNLKELENYKYILNYENSVSTKELFDTLKDYNVKIKAHIQSDTTEMRIEEVKQGQGIAYVMKDAADDAVKNKEVYEVKLPIELPEMKINLVYIEKYLTKIDKIFIKKYLKD